MSDKSPDSEAVTFTRSTGNVFADLGQENADELQVEALLTIEIYRIIKQRKLSQRQAAKLLGLAPADVNALMNMRYTGFSIRRLAGVLNKLGRDVEIVVKRRPKSQTGRFTVRRAA